MKTCLSCNYNFESCDWVCPSCMKQPTIHDNRLVFSPEVAEKSEGFNAEHFAELFSLESTSFWFRARNKLINWALRRYFSNASNFLEIGCGTGFVLSSIERQFPNLNLYGSEVFSNGLNFAAKRVSGATLFQMDARKIPFKNEFDVIGAFDVLEHVKEDSLVLRNIHSALKPGGGIVITVPQHQFLWSKYDEYSCHIRRYSNKDLRLKVQSLGFKVKILTSFVSFLLPIVFIARLRWRNSFSEYDSMSQYKISRLLDSSFEKVLDLERLMISFGVRFPLGSSLLLVAIK